MNINAEIITIGDEILIGQIVDTNTSFIAQLLNSIGVNVCEDMSIADNREQIIATLDKVFEKSELVLVTGGLGPTNDDITKQTLAEYFGAKKMTRHEPSLKIIENLLKRRNIPMIERNMKQADLPDCCTPILNKNGTAPAMWFERNGKVLISMPGVPFETKAIMQDVIPMIKSHFKLENIYHKTVNTYGIPESVLADKIKNWEDNLPKHLHLAYLPSPEFGVRLRLSAYHGEKKEEVALEISKQFAELKKILGSAVYSEDNDNLALVVGKMLMKKNAMMATAESCTGGQIAATVVKNPGASEYFAGSVVSYSYEVKKKVLGVNADDLERYGAVSKQVVEQMAQGVLRVTGAQYSVAVSGVAGPDGGTPDKPVGTIWFAVATPTETISQKYVLSTLREVNIARATSVALNMLRLRLIEEA